MAKILNREDWLAKCTQALRNDFEAIGFPLPEKIRASCSWPSKHATSAKAMRIGEAWSDKSSADGTYEVFISPALHESARVADVLVHELCHCAVGLACKHRGPFAEAARAIGLEGKLTATVAGEELKARLQKIVAKIGEYPHAQLRFSNLPKAQTCRQLKVVCEECGCIVRMSRKAIDDVGCPTCACGGEMAEA